MVVVYSYWHLLNAGKFRLLVFVSFTMLFLSCNKKYKDYSLLSSYAGNNNKEIEKLIRGYKGIKGSDERKAMEYILDALVTQYRVRYFLINDKQDSLLFSGFVSLDSIEALRSKERYFLSTDTIWDIQHVNADMIINHVTQTIKNWKENSWSKNYSFEQFCKYLLPYRVGNEQIYNYIGLFQNRYMPFIKDILRYDNDTLGILLKYITLSQNRTYNKLNRIDFFSNASLDNTIKDIDNCNDIEDACTMNIHALRSLSAPSAYEFFPHVRRNSTSFLLPCVIIGKENSFYDKPKDSLRYKFRISKAYRNTFDLSIAQNPFAEILCEGVNISDIPLSLNLPKMIDITQQKTIAKDISISVSDTLLSKKIYYIACFIDNTWRIVSWGKINPLKKTIIFRKMGTEVLYHLTDFSKGKMQMFGEAFTVDSTGAIKTFSPLNNTGQGDIKITKVGVSTPVMPRNQYDLYYWDSKKFDWQIIASLPSYSDTVLTYVAPVNKLYKITSKDIDISKQRIFTYENGKQIWW